MIFFILFGTESWFVSLFLFFLFETNLPIHCSIYLLNLFAQFIQVNIMAEIEDCLRIRQYAQWLDKNVPVLRRTPQYSQALVRKTSPPSKIAACSETTSAAPSAVLSTLSGLSGHSGRRNTTRIVASLADDLVLHFLQVDVALCTGSAPLLVRLKGSTWKTLHQEVLECAQTLAAKKRSSRLVLIDELRIKPPSLYVNLDGQQSLMMVAEKALRKMQSASLCRRKDLEFQTRLLGRAAEALPLRDVFIAHGAEGAEKGDEQGETTEGKGAAGSDQGAARKSFGFQRGIAWHVLDKSKSTLAWSFALSTPSKHVNAPHRVYTEGFCIACGGNACSALSESGVEAGDEDPETSSAESVPQGHAILTPMTPTSSTMLITRIVRPVQGKQLLGDANAISKGLRVPLSALSLLQIQGTLRGLTFSEVLQFCQTSRPSVRPRVLPSLFSVRDTLKDAAAMEDDTLSDDGCAITDRALPVGSSDCTFVSSLREREDFTKILRVYTESICGPTQLIAADAPPTTELSAYHSPAKTKSTAAFRRMLVPGWAHVAFRQAQPRASEHLLAEGAYNASSNSSSSAAAPLKSCLVRKRGASTSPHGCLRGQHGGQGGQQGQGGQGGQGGTKRVHIRSVSASRRGCHRPSDLGSESSESSDTDASDCTEF